MERTLVTRVGHAVPEAEPGGPSFVVYVTQRPLTATRSERPANLGTGGVAGSTGLARVAVVAIRYVVPAA